jgi:hypothetical protein
VDWADKRRKRTAKICERVLTQIAQILNSNSSDWRKYEILLLLETPCFRVKAIGTMLASTLATIPTFKVIGFSKNDITLR